jgi:hypothetical protein
MKRERPQESHKVPASGGAITDEDVLLEEIRQLRAAIQIYRELVERLLTERKNRD